MSTDDLGPAEGDFRTWLDLAIVKGMDVHFCSASFAGNRVEYLIADHRTGYTAYVYNVQDIKNLFNRVDHISPQSARVIKVGVSQI